jgi:hypothetical protein
MNSYIGTKIINAEPCYKEDMANFLPSLDPAPKTPGYKLVYEDGYVSWSPKDVFERSYREITDKEKVIIGLNLL